MKRDISEVESQEAWMRWCDRYEANNRCDECGGPVEVRAALDREGAMAKCLWCRAGWAVSYP